MTHNDVVDGAISMPHNPLKRLYDWLFKARVTTYYPHHADGRHKMDNPDLAPEEIKAFFDIVYCHYPDPKSKNEKALAPFPSGTSMVLTVPFKDDFQKCAYHLFSGQLPNGKKALVYIQEVSE